MSQFTVRINDQYSLKGNDYVISNPKASLLIFTGMQEYSARYKPFALEMNALGYSVYVLDHFGQGENAKSIEEQQQSPKDCWELELKALNTKVKELHTKNLPVYIMGHSMGSFYMQSYLQHYPNSVDKMVIMSSNGPGSPYGFAKFLSHITTTKSNWNKPSKFINALTVGAYKVKGQKTSLDWLSYNEENVKTYLEDPYCGHPNTCGFYHEFLKGMATLYKKENLKKISHHERLLLVFGEEDPVGGKKGGEKLYKMYKDLGVKDVTLKIYPKMRHEILNEVNRKDVVDDIAEFLAK